MKRITLTILAVAMLASFAGVATADTRIDRRQDRQRARIQSGFFCGDLTRAELRVLRNGQVQIRRIERRAWADGHLTWRERAEIRRAQNRQDRLIARFCENHDHRDWDNRRYRG